MVSISPQSLPPSVSMTVSGPAGLSSSDAQWLVGVCLFGEGGTHSVSTTSQTSVPQGLITPFWNKTPLKWMTFIKAVLGDRCLCWWGEHTAGQAEGALDQTYKCLNKQLGRFFFLLLSFGEAPLRASRLQPPGCASCPASCPKHFNHGWNSFICCDNCA